MLTSKCTDTAIQVIHKPENLGHFLWALALRSAVGELLEDTLRYISITKVAVSRTACYEATNIGGKELTDEPDTNKSIINK